MKLLVDTDAFCKFGVAGLLQDAVNIFDAALHECGRLPALPHMLRRGRLRKQYGDEACDALISLADAMPAIPEPSNTWLEKLTHIPGIDPGDAQILAAAAELGLIVISGDKRALHAVKDIEGFADALCGRVVVLEAVLLRLCENIGDKMYENALLPLLNRTRFSKPVFRMITSITVKAFGRTIGTSRSM